MYMIKHFEKDKAKQQHKPNPKAVIFQRKFGALYMYMYMYKLYLLLYVNVCHVHVHVIYTCLHAYIHCTCPCKCMLISIVWRFVANYFSLLLHAKLISPV